MVIFHCYVSLPEGTSKLIPTGGVFFMGLKPSTFGPGWPLVQAMIEVACMRALWQVDDGGKKGGRYDDGLGTEIGYF